MNRRWIASVVAVGVLALWSVAASAEEKKEEKKADATIRLSEGSFAAGIGWSWGHGTMAYKGKSYKIKIEGLSVGEVGLTNVKAKGNVYNLKKLEDFDGVYAAGGAEATAGKGMGATALTNANGVSILLTSVTKGANLKIAAEGLKLQLEK